MRIDLWAYLQTSTKTSMLGIANKESDLSLPMPRIVMFCYYLFRPGSRMSHAIELTSIYLAYASQTMPGTPKRKNANEAEHIF